MKFLTYAGALAALLFSLATPLASTAMTTGDRSVTFDTALAPQYYGAGEYDGVLHLTIASDGAIMGYYRDGDTADVRTVFGGITGDRIWLDLGRGGPPITGTYDGGKIVGYTYLEGQTFVFTAKPVRPA